MPTTRTVHRIVEATKLAFGLRDAHITDPRH
jgi:gamma-glutamyltranspeptidase/glutathione hydrolase